MPAIATEPPAARDAVLTLIGLRSEQPRCHTETARNFACSRLMAAPTPDSFKPQPHQEPVDDHPSVRGFPVARGDLGLMG